MQRCSPQGSMSQTFLSIGGGAKFFFPNFDTRWQYTIKKGERENLPDFCPISERGSFYVNFFEPDGHTMP